MAEAHDLLVQASLLDHEAGELEAHEVAEKELAAAWDSEADQQFVTLAEAQLERDWHLQNADTSRRRARKLKRRANRLRRRAERKQKRDGL